MKAISVYLTGTVLSLFLACTSVEDAVVVEDPIVTPKSAESIVEANNNFAFAFLKEINAAEKEPNFMVSPVSLSLALGMAYNGSQEETKKAFEYVLQYVVNRDIVNQFNKNLMEALASSQTGSVLEIANSIWIDELFPVKDSFTLLNQTYYNAEVRNLDFLAPASTDIINQWVSDKTHEKIPTIINETKGYVLFLINALYFNANWKYQFDETYTQKRPFYPAPQQEVFVDMMTMTEDLKWYENELISSVILPYEGEKFSMVVLLPQPGKTTHDVVSALNGNQWKEWQQQYQEEEVAVTLPKFKMSYENKLNDELINMGLGIAFTARANFSDISSIPILISFVLQKTFIDVKEEGTEAAAVTVIGFETTAIPSEPMPQFFTADRPFVYFIQDNATGSICFAGKVGSPEYEE